MTVNFEEWDRTINTDATDLDGKRKLYDDMKAELTNNETNKNNSEVLWRLNKVSLLLSISSDIETNQQRQLAFEALEYGKRSVKADPKSLDSHKWYCIALGRATKLVGVKDKIRYGHEFKQHLDLAYKLDPNDHMLHFMAGRFAYELAALSWIERNIARALYGPIPEATYQEALQKFFDSDKSKPNWKDNYLWIAKTYRRLRKKTTARQWVNKGLNLPTNNIMDELAHKELQQLKDKLS
ncbi:regulator of microtubule dynamics protein 2-like [Oppia nitens]|uniref:regulator of microtubule dynamics protein 2-like n=1 Tax=Oppia nitens TaxID=1686743 RepID=UPI0023DB92F4|nr:regulator of microtubule dynamics protein 2-like [Oppia nitens]